ncbi:hypothetical protein BDR07DRAFT_1377623 [Suillus spraguei]|nr:hypothetical protein BDR07DRAFT_1377623 [Suillus spraguei]
MQLTSQQLQEILNMVQRSEASSTNHNQNVQLKVYNVEAKSDSGYLPENDSLFTNKRGLTCCHWVIENIQVYSPLLQAGAALPDRLFGPFALHNTTLPACQPSSCYPECHTNSPRHGTGNEDQADGLNPHYLPVNLHCIIQNAMQTIQNTMQIFHTEHQCKSPKNTTQIFHIESLGVFLREISASKEKCGLNWWSRKNVL